MKHMAILYSLWAVILLAILAPSCPAAKTKEEYLQLGEHFMAEGDFIQAANNFTKAIEKDSAYFQAYYKRAQAWEQSDSISKAIADYDKLLSFPVLSVDRKGELLYLRGNMYYLSMQDTLACNDWKAARDIGYNKAYDRVRFKCK